MRRFLFLLVLPLLTVHAGEKKSETTLAVRLHAEGNPKDGETFGTSIDLVSPPQKLYIKKVPVVTEADFVSFFPFPAPNGTLGAYFKLDPNGTNKLEAHTVEARGSLSLAMIAGRVASAMRVDKKITDGVLVIHSGFQPDEILLLQTKFPTIGQEKNFEKQKKKALGEIKDRKRRAEEALPKPTAKPRK
jgi:hypothetical protein